MELKLRLISLCKEIQFQSIPGEKSLGLGQQFLFLASESPYFLTEDAS